MLETTSAWLLEVLIEVFDAGLWRFNSFFDVTEVFDVSIGSKTSGVSFVFECFCTIIDEEFSAFKLVDDGDDPAGLSKNPPEALFLLK